MIKQKIIFIISLTLIVINVRGQVAINQYDEDGKRHGKWSKNFENTDLIRYEGQFNHGKETGEFRFYQKIGKTSKLAAIKVFDENTGIADVRFLTLKGKVISEGKMRGKAYVGKWKYYHKNSDRLMSVEHFNDDGLLDGKKSVYYSNGQLAEEMTFSLGKKEGTSTYYAPDGKLMKVYEYRDDQLHGPSKHYDDNGLIMIEGSYRNGKKHGIWNYYKNGEFFEEKNFSLAPRRKKGN